MLAPSLRNWILFPILLIGGVVVGLMLPFNQIRNSIASVFDLEMSQSAEDEEPPAEGLHVDVTESAQDSLGLIVRRVKLGEYTSTYDIPARIATLPGAE